MYLEDIETPQGDKDVTHSCIFNWPDRPPDTLPPNYIPPGGPPGCHPYCSIVDPIDPIIPILPIPPEEEVPPGTYPPGPFMRPRQNEGNLHWGYYFNSTPPSPAPPYPTHIPPLGPLPPTDNLDTTPAIKASCGKFAGRLFTPDGTGHGFFFTDHQEGSAEYTVHQLDLRNIRANLYRAKLLGTQLTSQADGSNIQEEVELDLVAGTVSRFSVEVPPIGAIWGPRDDNPAYHKIQTQSSSVVYHSLKVEDIPL